MVDQGPESRSFEVEKGQQNHDRKAAHTVPAGKRALKITGIVLLTIATLLAIYGLVAYAAWQHGQQERAESSQRAIIEELEKQFNLAQGDLEAGNLVLATRRLEWILANDRDYPGVQELQVQIEAAIEAQNEPTTMPTPTEPPATPQSAEDDTGAQEGFALLLDLVEGDDWTEVIDAIKAFQIAHPGYRRMDTDQMLYRAYVNYGLELVNSEQIELGLFYFEQAESLGDLSEEVEAYRVWADLYLLAMSYYGVDWGTTLYFLRDLCAAAPFYQNSCDRLISALVAYGDQYASILEWCPALDLYQEAYRMAASENLAEKLVEARSRCLEATPTPTATISITLPFTPTNEVSTPEAP